MPDRRPWGGNLVWPLIAAGVAGLFAMSLIGSTPELEFSYSDLERLVAAAKAEGDAQWIDIRPAGADPRSTARYGSIADVVIGPVQVTGSIRELPTILLV